MYIQVGGASGDGATLARENGAMAAAAALGISLKAQYLRWDPGTGVSALGAVTSCLAGLCRVVRR